MVWLSDTCTTPNRIVSVSKSQTSMPLHSKCFDADTTDWSKGALLPAHTDFQTKRHPWDQLKLKPTSSWTEWISWVFCTIMTLCPNYVRPPSPPAFPRYIIYYLTVIDFSNDNNIRFNKSFHVVSANFPRRHLPRLSFSTLDNCVVTAIASLYSVRPRNSLIHRKP